VLLVVRDEVFRARLDTDALDAGDGVEGAFAVEVGIGTEATERGRFNIRKYHKERRKHTFPIHVRL
jgi:hypothetical protein